MSIPIVLYKLFFWTLCKVACSLFGTYVERLFSHENDRYHINVETGIHITYFELHVTSVFRIYVLSDEGVKVGLYPAIQGAPLLHSVSLLC